MDRTLTLPIQNMTCGSCASRVGRVLDKVAGIRDIHVNFAGECAQLTVRDARPVKEAMQALSQAGYPVQTQQVSLSVSGMSCASCASQLAQALRGDPAIVDAQVNFATQMADVAFLPGDIAVADILARAADAGYPVSVADTQDENARDAACADDAAAHKRMVVRAGALTLPVFILEMGGHVFPAWHHLIARTIGMEVSWAVQGVLTTAVLLGPGRGFFTNGLPALWRRAPNMNALVALGAGAAWLFSMVVLLMPSALPDGTRAVYFEAAAVIVTLILLGRWFEARAKGQTGSAIRKLIGLQPRTALVQQGDAWIEVDVQMLQLGDVFLLHPGARVPTDGVVVSGTSRVDESMLTGEPMQVAKMSGDALTGGSVNGHGSLTCRVERVGQDTTLSQIVRMVQQAQGARLPIQALVDRVTLWFVPAVIAVTVLTVVIWVTFGPDPALSLALVAGVSVLIIACPCAMGLATPTSIMVGTGRAAELGVLFRQGDALQSLDQVAVIAVDKTGTLTRGQPTLTMFEPVDGFDRDETLGWIAALEQHSEHPLARAVLAAADGQALKHPAAIDVKALPGRGLVGDVEGHRVAVGNKRLMLQEGAHAVERLALSHASDGQTVFFAAIDGQVAAVLSVSDPLRPTSAQAIAALQARGLKVAMITGDAEPAARAVAQKLGIGAVFAGALPEGKMAALRELRATYGPVAFVGDGINDAPVLAEADVGIAIGSGTEVAIETADVVLMSADLNGVVQALTLSRQTLRNIKQNLCWAFGYNTVLIPVAAGVMYPGFGLLLSPGLAAAAMAFSSVFVLGNALRLRKAGGTV